MYIYIFSIDLVYTETLLYIVHVDEIKLTTDQEHDTNDKQKSSQVMRRISKRTTASFNERQQNREIQTSNIPISTPPSFSFSNPFRRLNSNQIEFIIINRGGAN